MSSSSLRRSSSLRSPIMKNRDVIRPYSVYKKVENIF